MTETGRVLSVEEQLPGSTLSATALAGDEALSVASTEDFAEGGGTLQVRSGSTVQIIDYGPPDDVALTLPLLTPLESAAEESDEVSLPGAIERYAAVALEDAPDEAILARIPHSLIQKLPAGVRDLDDLDAVRIREEKPGLWVVEDVLAREFARVGIAETDWRNGKGLYLVGGDPQGGEGLFGVGVISAEMVAENAGPVATTFPLGSSDTWRRIGRIGVNSGAIQVVTDFPAKVTLSAVASIINTSGDDWNARLYIAAINPDTDEEYRGRQGTNYCPGGDGAASPQRHRQITNERQIFFDASMDSPTTMNFWWGFSRDAGASGSVSVRNLKMTLRVSYAPDVPIDADTPAAIEVDEDREPRWTSHDLMKESYLRIEGNDTTE